MGSCIFFDFEQIDTTTASYEKSDLSQTPDTKRQSMPMSSEFSIKLTPCVIERDTDNFIFSH